MNKTSKRLPRVQVAVLVALVGLIFGIAPLHAQDIGGSSNESLRSDILKRMSGKATSPDLSSLTAYEGVIDRNVYLVGPGDKLMLQVWSPTYEEVPVLVTGEGRVAVPYAGPVEVAGKTLAETEQLISAEFDKALRKGRISISLLEPRQFRVHVTGQVLVPGTYTLSATQRVADAIDKAGGVRFQVRIQEGDSIAVPQAALRRIEMRSAVNGDITPVDLLRYYQGGDLTGNPHLHDGVVVYVPAQTETPQIGIFGEVRLPGVYDYATGDDVGTLLGLAGGLTALADSGSIQIQDASGGTQGVTLSASGLGIPMKPGDRLYIGGTPLAKTTGSVSISGQVTKPGGYSITPGVTTVKELVEMAGGMLPEAAAQSARLVRYQDDRIHSERQRLTNKPLRSQSKDDPSMLADMEMSAEFSRWSYGTVVMDLTAEEGDPGWSGEVTLEDGDRLEIPSQPMGVRVLGYVNHAGEVPWIENGDLNYYLAQAGGKNAAGWKGRAVILKARNGSQLRYTSKITVDPGDVLFVPQRPRTTGWERIKDIITVAAQVATIVLVIDSATK